MMIRRKQVWGLTFAVFIFQFLSGQIGYGQSVAAEISEPGKILEALAENFRNKIDDKYSTIVQFEILDNEEFWNVVVQPERRVTVNEGRHEQAQFFISITADTLRLIYDGKMTAMTAAGKAGASERPPLDVGLAEGLEFTPEIRTQFYTFLYHFFNVSEPERILLGEEYSRMVHGGHVCALYYHPGFRSAWYMLKKGEKLNEPGDTNPHPQAFVFIEGEGFAKIGDKTVPVKAGESYYIPPNSDHVVWTESEKPLVLIYLAWGKGA